LKDTDFDGAAGGTGTMAFAIPLAWELVATPDFNGDGNPDLLWQNRQFGPALLLDYE
jgi:hypothetical protein